MSLIGGGFGWASATATADGGVDYERPKSKLYSWGRPPFSSSDDSGACSDVLTAAAGYDHAVLSKSDGSLWFCGWLAGVFGEERAKAEKEKKNVNSSSSSASSSSSSSSLARWTPLPFLRSPASPVSALACGFDRTLALTHSEEEGMLWEWGGGVGESENEGERGLEEEEAKGPPPPPPPAAAPRPVPSRDANNLRLRWGSPLRRRGFAGFPLDLGRQPEGPVRSRRSRRRSSLPLPSLPFLARGERLLSLPLTLPPLLLLLRSLPSSGPRPDEESSPGGDPSARRRRGR